MPIEYDGHTFPGYNQPIRSSNPDKKKMVLVKKATRCGSYTSDSVATSTTTQRPRRKTTWREVLVSETKTVI